MITFVGEMSEPEMLLPLKEMGANLGKGIRAIAF
jgi:hypothetical protein